MRSGSPDGAIAQAAGDRVVGRVDQIANEQALQTRIGNTRLVVIRNPNSPNTLVALNQNCPQLSKTRG
ncbi:MAG: hypothetical protein SFY66_23900 [Oculatellaceae cyanobacterium bins.114]|nr:hypothetical protein [Oculatellaceae cyanobacterium bins.114]